MEESHLPGDCYREIYIYLDDYQTIVNWFLTSRFFNAMIDEATKKRYRYPIVEEYIECPDEPSPCHSARPGWIHYIPRAALGTYRGIPVIMLYEKHTFICPPWPTEVLEAMETLPEPIPGDIREETDFVPTKEYRIWRFQNRGEITWRVDRDASYRIYTHPDLVLKSIDLSWIDEHQKDVEDDYRYLGEVFESLLRTPN